MTSIACCMQMQSTSNLRQRPCMEAGQLVDLMQGCLQHVAALLQDVLDTISSAGSIVCPYEVQDTTVLVLQRGCLCIGDAGLYNKTRQSEQAFRRLICVLHLPREKTFHLQHGILESKGCATAGLCAAGRLLRR